MHYPIQTHYMQIDETNLKIAEKKDTMWFLS